MSASHVKFPFPRGAEHLRTLETAQIHFAQTLLLVVVHHVLALEHFVAFGAREFHQALDVQLQIVSLDVVFSFELFPAKRASVVHEIVVFENLGKVSGS